MNFVEPGLFAEYEISVVLISSFLHMTDFLRTNPTDFNPMNRSRSDYYNRFRPDVNGVRSTLFVIVIIILNNFS